MRVIKFRASLMMCMLVMFVFPCILHAQYDPYVSEDFKGSTAPDWTFITAAGDGPVLTGNGTIDPVDEGWLRLTADKTNQNSFVYYNNAIPSKYGLVFNFDFVIWSSTSSIADGFALVIFDAEADPVAAGGWGGSLGYAQHTSQGNVGLNGGIAGFGFDTFGNFSRASEGRIGGPGQSPHSIAIRGSMGATRSLGYEYVTGVYDLPVFSKGSVTSRTSATVYSVRLTISTERKVTIEWKPAGGSWSTLLNEYECTLTCPEYVKFGYTASTGSVFSYQEIRNLEVAPLEDPTLIELSSFEAGWQQDGVSVRWVTDMEIDHAYFDLYRAESRRTFSRRFNGFGNNIKRFFRKNWMRTGPYIKVNADPILAEGLAPFGASYEYVDTDVNPRKRYWYILQDVDFYGTITQHGPCGPVSVWEDCSYDPWMPAIR